jgi:FkbM family methyltransferase
MCGWRCVNVDANPKSIELFNKYRKSDTNIHAAVITQQEWAEGKTEVELLLPSKSDKDGLSAVGTAVLSQAPADYERVTVPSVSISQVLESNDLQNVSYINIDIEGYDEVVLLDIDLVRYRPKVITVEQFAEDVKDVANSEVARFMRDHRSVAFASQLHIHVCKGTLVRVSFEPIGSVPPLIT